MKIASDDPRWNVRTAALSSNDMTVLSPPLDLTPKGSKEWVATIQARLMSKPAGSDDRKAFIEEAKRQFGYVKYLFKGRKALHKFLDDSVTKLEAMVDTAD